MEISVEDAFQIIGLTLDSQEAPRFAYKALNFIYEEYNRLQLATRTSPCENAPDEYLK